MNSMEFLMFSPSDHTALFHGNLSMQPDYTYFIQSENPNTWFYPNTQVVAKPIEED